MFPVGLHGFGILTSTHVHLRMLAVVLALINFVPVNTIQPCYCYPGEYCLNEKCVHCPYGTFQMGIGHNKTSCMSWTQRGRGWVIDKNGTAQSDTQWKCADSFDMFNNTECLEKETEKETDLPGWLVAIIVIVVVLFVVIISGIICFMYCKRLCCFSMCGHVENNGSKHADSNEDANKVLLKSDTNKADKSGRDPKYAAGSETVTLPDAEMNKKERKNMNSNDNVSTSQSTGDGANDFAKLHDKVAKPCDKNRVQIQSATKDQVPKGYVAKLNELIKKIRELISPEEFKELFTLYLYNIHFDREEGITDLVTNYIQWARRNPEHNFASDFRKALLSLGYTLQDLGNNSNLDFAHGIENLKKSIDKKITMKNAFNKLCTHLLTELGKDVLKLFTELNINYQGTLDRESLIATFDCWYLKSTLEENESLEKLKTALRNIKRIDIYEKFDDLARETLSEYTKLYH